VGDQKEDSSRAGGLGNDESDGDGETKEEEERERVGEAGVE
jgi:hypothetical protein